MAKGLIADSSPSPPSAAPFVGDQDLAPALPTLQRDPDQGPPWITPLAPLDGLPIWGQAAIVSVVVTSVFAAGVYLIRLFTRLARWLRQ